MLYAYIAVIAAAVLLIVFAAVSLKILSSRTAADIRKRNLDILSDYDTLIEEKSEKLSLIQSDINAAEEKLKKLEKEAAKYKAKKDEIQTVAGIYNALSKISEDSSDSESVADVYGTIKEGFKTNASLLEMHRNIQAEGSALAAESLLKDLSMETVYQLMAVNSRIQKQMLDESLDEPGRKLLTEYCKSTDNFDALGFYEYLKALVAQNPSKPRLYVPVNSRPDMDLSGFEVIENSSICEGFQIERDGVLYDYSVQRREIK